MITVVSGGGVGSIDLALGREGLRGFLLFSAWGFEGVGLEAGLSDLEFLASFLLRSIPKRLDAFAGVIASSGSGISSPC